MEERIGQQLGSYRLVHLLGQGGFADVYLGEHVHLQTLAAVKVLQMRLLGSNLEQFRNEARTIASLIHPHIVRVLDFGVEDGVPFLVMDYAPHGTLGQAHPKGSCLPPIHAVSYVNQIADALSYAHSRKLIHRDIKPENILLGANGKLLLSDFGLVQAVQNTTSQTTKEMAGTIAYMAPEQLHGKPRPASDQYALGIVVYEWLSGDRLFHGSLFEIATQHMLSTPRSLYGNVSGVSREVEMVVFRALAKDPQQRFATIKDFASAFEQASRATQEYDPSLPTLILPSSAFSSPFNTALMSTVSQSGAMDDVSDQSASVHATPVLSPPKTDLPTPVDSLWQAIHVHTPLPLLNHSQSQFSADQWVSSHNDSHLYSQPSVLPDKATAQKTSHPQSLFVPTQTKAGGSSKLFANGIYPAIDYPTPMIDLKFGKLWQIALMLVLLIGGVAGTVAYALTQRPVAPSTSHSLSLAIPSSSPEVNHKSSPGASAGIHTVSTARSPVFLPVPSGSATVHISPSSKDVKNVFTISAVMGIPDSSQSQVQARQVTASQSQSQTTVTTGSKQIPATRASGTLAVTCHTPSSPLTINAGTVFTGNDKVSIVTDSVVTTNGCHTTISAHAVIPGQSGNIAASDISQPYQNYTVLNESAFTGGQDTKTTTVVTQSDIDASALSLKSVLTPLVKQALPGKLRANERSFGNAQCTSVTTADHPTGDEAAKVTVTVSMSCTSEAFDDDGAQALAKDLLRSQAANDPGANYSLAGNIVTTVGQPTLVDMVHGTISLPVTAEGIWVYQWGDTQKQKLAKLVAGRSTQDAQILLVRQEGVDWVQIQLSRGSITVLPSETSRITMNVLAISGL